MLRDAKANFIVPLMECIFLNRVCHVDDLMFLREMIDFSNRVIGIISLEMLFPSSIADTMNWFQNSMSD